MQAVQFSYTLQCTWLLVSVLRRGKEEKNNGRSHPCKQEKIQGKKSEDSGEERAYKCSKLLVGHEQCVQLYLIFICIFLYVYSRLSPLKNPQSPLSHPCQQL